MAAGPVRHSFCGHETFPFRYPWLKKGFDAVRADAGIFLRDDAITTLGVGKNMVRSIRHWCLTAEVSERFFGPGGPLPRKVGRLCPVLVTGSRQPMEKALAASLALSLRALPRRGRPQLLIERLELLARQQAPSASSVVHLFEEVNEHLERFGNDAAGLLLIVDELGKFLEYGASNPEQGDVFILQELAEAASRSRRQPYRTGRPPFWVRKTRIFLKLANGHSRTV